MKNLQRVVVIALLIVALALVACAPKPPPVSQNQFNEARQETLDAEQRVLALEREKSQLETEIMQRQALRDVLLEMVDEME
ncbi:MAG: hypothetical protein FWG98_07760 [Candidatus Cloacimonetes bacterium]|nr:hypothetical protein [Candidatus Cloacimonadota bacterium]